MLVSSLLFLRGKKNYHRGILYYLFCLSFVVNIGLLRQPERNLVISSLDLKLSSNARVSLLAKPWLRRRVPNTLSRQWNRNPGGCSIYKRCVLDFYLSFCITLYQNNNKTASFFTQRFWPQFAQQYYVFENASLYRQAVLERHRHRRNAFARVCVCTVKFFSPI